MLAATLLFGYLLGAIPSGAIVARVYGRVDLTQVGSRRTGATNVLRTLGLGAAAIVFVADCLKGSAAVALASSISDGDPWARALAGGAAVFGHAYSPFIGFKGGRGVVSGFGSSLIIAPLAGAVGLLAALSVTAATRYVSLGSLVGTIVCAFVIVLLVFTAGQPLANVGFAVVVGAFIIVAHRDNISRVLRGTERRLGEPAELGS